MRSSGGEIVQVEGGGHIVKSTGRKDRHSKVYTSKGPRDRRVRLSAHTAIEFYDVQDRLGYDRPSKAVDWLIKKAKPSIDKLAELPPWHPNPENTKPHEEEDQNAAPSGLAIGEQSESSGYNNNNFHSGSPFISPHVETDHPVSLFPTTSTSSLNFQNYPHENLGLSLHSFQDHPGFIHWQSQEASANQTPSNEQHQTLFSGSNVGFENHYNRILSWNNEGNNRMGFMVNSQPFLGQSSSIQPSFSPSVRTWNEIPMASLENQRSQQVNQGSIFGSRFGLAGFNIPHRIEVQYEEENHGGSSNRPSSASTGSHQ